jgi:hypothetical protein
MADKTSSNKKILTITVIAVIIIAIAVTAAFMLYNQKPKTEYIAWTCTALATGNKDYCDKITKPQAIDTEEGRIQLYETVPDQEEIANCKEEVTFKEAISGSDSALCSQISSSNLQKACTAIISNNAGSCTTINDNVEKTACQATVNRDVNLCGQIAGQNAYDCKDSVYTNLAIITKDIEYCNKLKSELGQLNNDYLESAARCVGAATGKESNCKTTAQKS